MIAEAEQPVHVLERVRERGNIPGLIEYSEVTAVFRAHRGQLMVFQEAPTGNTRFCVEHGLDAPPNDVRVNKLGCNYGWAVDGFAPGQPFVPLTDDRKVVRSEYDPTQPEEKYRNTWTAGSVHLETSDPLSDAQNSYFTIGLSCYPWSTIFRIDTLSGGLPRMTIALPAYVGVVLAMHANWLITGAIPVGSIRVQPEGINLTNNPVAVEGGMIYGPPFAGNGMQRAVRIESTSASDVGKYGLLEVLCGPKPETLVTVKVRSELWDRPTVVDPVTVSGTRAHPAP